MASRCVAADAALERACDVLARARSAGCSTTRHPAPAVPRGRGCGEQPARERPARTEQLAARDVLFVPDFVASAGGIINIAEEFVGYDRARALERTAGIEARRPAVLARRRERGVTPQRAAEELARGRIARGGRRPPLGARRPRRVDQRRAAHPAAPVTPRHRLLGVAPRILTTPLVVG